MTLRKTMLALALGALTVASTIDTVSAGYFGGGFNYFGGFYLIQGL